MAPTPEGSEFPLRYERDALKKALMSNQPTYRMGEPPDHFWPDLEARNGPEHAKADVGETLKTLADRLQAGEQPDTLTGPAAFFVATLAGETHVFNLGTPENHVPEMDQRLYTLRREGQGWVATRICEHRGTWVAVHRLKSGEPVLFCGRTTGNGRPHRYVAVYRGSAEILRLDRLQADRGGFEILPGEPDGPPPVRVIHYNDWFGNGRMSDWILERVTLTWDGSQYVASKREWLDNWAYHFTRFDALLEGENPELAASELAFSPEGGLSAYLEAQAPGLQEVKTQWAWPRWDSGDKRLYVCAINLGGGDCGKAPWYWFEFTPEGLIAAVGRQSEPPKQN